MSGKLEMPPFAYWRGEMEAAKGDESSRDQFFETASDMLSALREKFTDAEALCARLMELEAGAKNRLAEINAIATEALTSKTQISDDQAVIAAKSSHINEAQAHADKVRAELDRLQTAAALQASETEGLRQRAQTATDSASEILAAIQTQKASVDADAVATAAARDEAKSSAKISRNLADKSESTEEKLSAYENRLDELEAQSRNQLETINGLLPGATATSLAYAFDDRRKAFLRPTVRWQWLFICSLVAVVLLALSGLWQAYGSESPLTWDEMARLWVARLPIAGALVWLALHASHESALAKRLEEDYGYKAAVAASFQGFQQQMKEIGTSAPDGSPLGKLCGDTLATISNPPGRIYDKHKLTTSLVNEVLAAANEVADKNKNKN